MGVQTIGSRMRSLVKAIPEQLSVVYYENCVGIYVLRMLISEAQPLTFPKPSISVRYMLATAPPIYPYPQKNFVILTKSVDKMKKKKNT